MLRLVSRKRLCLQLAVSLSLLFISHFVYFGVLYSCFVQLLLLSFPFMSGIIDIDPRPGVSLVSHLTIQTEYNSFQHPIFIYLELIGLGVAMTVAG